MGSQAESTGWITPLFVPANRPERFAKAAASGADLVIIDLEDALPPDDKIQARDQLDLAPLASHPAAIRLNAIGTPWHDDDVLRIGQLRPRAVMLPKAEDASAVVALADALALPFILIIETALGLSRARELAAVPGAVLLAFGSVDFAADLGLRPTRDSLLHARSEIVLASRLAGLSAPHDGVTIGLEPATVEDDARYASDLGFGGKLCIHPAQIGPALAGLAPAPEEIAWAEEIVALGDASVLFHKGSFVDEPVRKRALRILARSRSS